MPDYRAMYFTLAAHIADAIETLIESQQICEEMAMVDDIGDIVEFPPEES